jgi:hypothetical protein
MSFRKKNILSELACNALFAKYASSAVLIRPHYYVFILYIWKYCVSVSYIGFPGLCHVGVVSLLYIHFRYISKCYISPFYISDGALLPWHPMFKFRKGRVKRILRHSVQLYLEPTLIQPSSIASRPYRAQCQHAQCLWNQPFTLPAVSMLSIVACVEFTVSFVVLYRLDIVPW